jgi:hypothetical protein
MKSTREKEEASSCYVTLIRKVRGNLGKKGKLETQ